MSELRDALQSIVQCVSACNSAEEAVEHLVWISDKATAALEAPSEMQQLAEWLEAEVRDRLVPFGEDPDLSPGYSAALRHIRTKFLGEEKDG